MLNGLYDILAAKKLVSAGWASATDTQAKLVALYRDYARGKHRLKLTAEMRKMMQISSDLTDRYNANYCDLVVQTMADRLTVDTISGDTQEASAWLGAALNGNRFDALQIRVREALVRDGETFMMSEFLDDGTIKLAHEPAYDGSTGMIGILDASNELACAVKVWWDAGLGIRRANIYYRTLTERYVIDGTTLKVYAEPDDTTRNGQAPGLPVVRFANKDNLSELVNVIPLQDSLNRTLISMVMASELTAFSVMFAVGFKPPAGIMPGSIINPVIEGEDGTTIVPTDKESAEAVSALLNSYRLERIEAGSLEQLISQADFLISQIGTVSATPLPTLMGSGTQSGEALKQREVRLLSKVQRAQVLIGNAWEDVAAKMHRQASLFGTRQPPKVNAWTVHWKSAEARNDAALLEAAKLMQEWGHEREALRILSLTTMVNYSEDDLDRLMQEKAEATAATLRSATTQLPGMETLVP